MEIWGNGRGTATLGVVGAVLVGLTVMLSRFALFGPATEVGWAFVVLFAVVGAVCLGTAITSILCWALFTNRDLKDLFEV